MLLKLSKFFLYASLLSVVVVLLSTFFPFIGGKYYFFRVSVELSLIFFLLHWAFGDENSEAASRLRQIWKEPLFAAISIFVLMFTLAAVFAYDSHAAFWSNYERGDGGFQMVHYYVFFVLLVVLLGTERDWRRFFKFSLAAAVLMILYGVLANFGVSGFIGPYGGGTLPATFWGKVTEARFQGSLGNPAYIAPYLIFSIFYALYLWFGRKPKNKITRGIIYGGLIVIFLFFFVLSQTRGSFIGLAAALIASLAYLIVRSPEKRKPAITILVLVLALGAVLTIFRHTSFVNSLPGGRFFEIADLGYKTQTVQTRLWTWGSAWQGFKDRPILGWGPENFTPVFDKYFDPRHFIPGQSTETWFDRAHSVIFDYLAETGLLGFLSYLAIFITFYLGFRRWRSGADIAKGGANAHGGSNTAAVGALLLSLPIAYLVQGLALFDVLPIYINLFAFLGFAVYKFTQK